MTQAIVNALTMALMEYGHAELTEFASAKAFAARFVADNAELFAAPSPSRAAPAAPARGGGQYELSERQQKGLDRGIPLCPNCQQPTNDHLPGCARASQEDPRAVTKTPLSPVA
jgi:hypothetical protein